PFYEFTTGTEENKFKFFIEATSRKILYEAIPSSISKKQVNNVLTFLFIYFLFFALVSFFIKIPILSFFLTAIISIGISPFVVNYAQRRFS
ncbi:MAG: hypothetical protein N2445_05870, partial [Acidobacteria bacterium]|nr:hypothetical protein [Acidobacteriota bacterium]